MDSSIAVHMEYGDDGGQEWWCPSCFYKIETEHEEKCNKCGQKIRW